MGSGGKMSEREQHRWVALYRSALLELDHSRLPGRIRDARETMEKRLQELQQRPNASEELRALNDALHNLRVLAKNVFE